MKQRLSNPMAKWKAPPEETGITVGGAYFSVVDGHIEVPDEGNYSALLSHGYELVVEKTKAPAKAEPKKES